MVCPSLPATAPSLRPDSPPLVVPAEPARKASSASQVTLMLSWRSNTDTYSIGCLPRTRDNAVAYGDLGSENPSPITPAHERQADPVIITVANRTETAAQVQYAFAHGKIRIEELADPDKILHIDSKVLKKAEARDEVSEDQEPTEPEEGNGSGEGLQQGPASEVGKAGRAADNAGSEGARMAAETAGRRKEPSGMCVYPRGVRSHCGPRCLKLSFGPSAGNAPFL